MSARESVVAVAAFFCSFVALCSFVAHCFFAAGAAAAAAAAGETLVALFAVPASAALGVFLFFLPAATAKSAAAAAAAGAEFEVGEEDEGALVANPLFGCFSGEVRAEPGRYEEAGGDAAAGAGREGMRPSLPPRPQLEIDERRWISASAAISVASPSAVSSSPWSASVEDMDDNDEDVYDSGGGL